MVNYIKLGYSSLSEYSNDFLNTLLDSNHTYEFYVNWEKVFNNLKNSLIEISILNSLNKIPDDEIETQFLKIIEKYPEVVPLLPSILAIREKKVPIFDIDKKSSHTINFSKNEFDKQEIKEFVIKTGLLRLFNEIDDLYSYLVGTEVGLDTNARKNRSGHIFEYAIGELLENKIHHMTNYKIVKEDDSISIHRNKRFDYVIYKDNLPKIVLECNFYNSTGSKPIEVAHAYVDLQRDTNDSDLVFIWVTDGQGWHKMFPTLLNVAEEIDFIVNYHMLDELIDYLI